MVIDDLLVSFEDAQVLLDIKAAALKNKVPIVSDQVGQFLKMMVSLLKPANILEIGGGFGYSTCWMALGSSGVQITSLESNADRCKIMGDFFAQANLDKQIKIINIPAQQYFISSMTKIMPRFNMVFLDATKKEYPILLEPIVKSLQKQGIFIADNVNFAWRQGPRNIAGIAAMKNFINLFKHHKLLNSFYLALGDGLMVGCKK